MLEFQNTNSSRISFNQSGFPCPMKACEGSFALLIMEMPKIGQQTIDICNI